MESSFESFEIFTELKGGCEKIIKNPKNIEAITDLKRIIDKSSSSFVKVVQAKIVLPTFYSILKTICENANSYNENEKILIVDTLRIVFEKSKVEKLAIFFNFYSFLLFEIYDHRQQKVLDISEDYKLVIIKCMTALAKNISDDLIPQLYSKDNVPKLCQMLFVAVGLAKDEPYRSLKIAAIECIAAIARVLDEDDFNDVVTRNDVAEVFQFFLPGIVTKLSVVALEDEKVGHKVITASIQVLGRIVTLLMQDYNPSDRKLDFSIQYQEKINMKSKNKFENVDELNEYVKNSKRTSEWYKSTDQHLQPYFIALTKLTHNSNVNVRSELLQMTTLILENCSTTMPYTSSFLIEIIIILSEDDCPEISKKSTKILDDLSLKLSHNNFKTLLENLEEGFYNGINTLPRKFNGIDESEQLAAINLIVGYIRLFGKHNFNRVLLSTTFLNHFMMTLIHIVELENKEVSLLEDYSNVELDLRIDLRTPWKQFRCFRNEKILNKIQQLCSLTGKFSSFQLISDFLLNIIEYEEQNRKEAILLLNDVILGIELDEANINEIKNILSIYLEEKIWNLPLSVMIDEFGEEHTLGKVQSNVIQVYLLVEGIGKIALSLKDLFKSHLLKVMYPVLERAGNGHPLIRCAGLSALTNITISCNYSTVSDLINDNIDYFLYYVERKLKSNQDNDSVLNVLSVVLQYSQINVLQPMSTLINNVLIESCDKFNKQNQTSFLKIFKLFIKRLVSWLNITKQTKEFKTKAEIEASYEGFKVSNYQEMDNNFSDEIMKKSAEEMWKEDMEKKQEELENEIDESEVEEYKKSDPPLHIKMTVLILSRSLHFLPYKDRSKRLLVLEILIDGLEIIRDWEDELLPIVHQIWSPLVGRFKEFDDPLIINYSFKLLVVLARLSKSFIRMRTVKEVLPNILKVLESLAKESYLKDKGAAYRYSQNYKLQLNLLENIGTVLIDLDVADQHFQQTFSVVYKYLNNKQPIPLQVAAMAFFKLNFRYDPNLTKSEIDKLSANCDVEYRKNVTDLKNHFVN